MNIWLWKSKLKEWKLTTAIIKIKKPVKTKTKQFKHTQLDFTHIKFQPQLSHQNYTQRLQTKTPRYSAVRCQKFINHRHTLSKLITEQRDARNCHKMYRISLSAPEVQVALSSCIPRMNDIWRRLELLMHNIREFVGNIALQSDNLHKKK